MKTFSSFLFLPSCVLLLAVLLLLAHHVDQATAFTSATTTSSSSTPTTTTTPKEALAKLIAENLKTKDPTKLSPALIESKRNEFLNLLQSLHDQHKGFTATTVEGEWTSVLSLPGKKSRKQQSLVGNRVEKAGTTMANFDGTRQQILVTALTPRENGKIEAVLQYNPVPTNYSINPQGKIVLRRIACDNVEATLQYKWLPKLRIPFFKKKGGWLEFIYLDEDIRVTKGNRGGTFVHCRKEYLEKIVNQY